MRIKQFRCANNVRYFAQRMMDKFSLVPFVDESEPVILYGMYKDEDYELLKKTKGTVVWCGTDAMVVSQKRADIIKAHPHRHIAKSKQVQSSLRKWKIDSELIPVTSTPLDIQCKPRGNMVYAYVCSDNHVMYSKYRMPILQRLSQDLPYKFIFTTIKKYKSDELLAIYEKCFIGVRLLDHDGLSNSILEMGLMGRRTISNSGLPGTIPWGGYKVLKQNVEKEYAHRKEDNKTIPDAVRKFIDIDDQWLEYQS